MKKILLLFIIVSFSKIGVSQTPTFWGMANAGNINGAGGIFEANDNTTENNPYPDNFLSQSLGGGFILMPSGLLYGMTQYGGNYNNGAIFSYNIAAASTDIMHSFNGTDDGEYPQGSLLLASDGWLYGTTREGGQGSTTPAGALFRFDTITWMFEDLYFFDAGVYGVPAYPTAAPMQLNASLLYGFTSGTGYGNNGTIYYYNINNGILTVQHQFTGLNGRGPCGTPVFANDTVLYGMAYGGGTNGDGIIFKYDIFNNSETVLYTFSGSDGQNPAPNGSLLLVNDSLLYGLTSYGGANGSGVIFDYNILTGVESTLFNFNDTDGNQPNGSLIMGSDSLLYGTTIGGGINYVGTLFNFNPRTNVEHVFYNFPTLGPYNPAGDLLQVDVITTGTKQLPVNSSRLSVYPNPTSSYFHTDISLPQPTRLQLSLINVLGQTVWSADEGNVSQFNGNISVANLAEGVYLLEMKAGDGIQTQMVVVSR